MLTKASKKPDFNSGKTRKSILEDLPLQVEGHPEAPYTAELPAQSPPEVKDFSRYFERKDARRTECD